MLVLVGVPHVLLPPRKRGFDKQAPEAGVGFGPPAPRWPRDAVSGGQPRQPGPLKRLFQPQFPHLKLTHANAPAGGWEPWRCSVPVCGF